MFTLKVMFFKIAKRHQIFWALLKAHFSLGTLKNLVTLFREFFMQDGEDVVYFYDFVRVFAHFKPVQKNPEKNLMNLREDKLRCKSFQHMQCDQGSILYNYFSRN